MTIQAKYARHLAASSSKALPGKRQRYKENNEAELNRVTPAIRKEKEEEKDFSWIQQAPEAVMDVETICETDTITTSDSNRPT